MWSSRRMAVHSFGRCNKKPCRPSHQAVNTQCPPNWVNSEILGPESTKPCRPCLVPKTNHQAFFSYGISIDKEPRPFTVWHNSKSVVLFILYLAFKPDTWSCMAFYTCTNLTIKTWHIPWIALSTIISENLLFCLITHRLNAAFWQWKFSRG